MGNMVIHPITEEWKEINFLNGKYEVSNFGRIRNTKRKTSRSTPISKRGYPVFSASVGGRIKLINVHKCVAEAFIPNPEDKPCINHKDGNKQNNHVDNLEWCTYSENNSHARTTGLHISDGDKAVLQIKDGLMIAEYKSASEAARITGICRTTICNVCNKRISDGKHYRKAGGYEWQWKN